LNNLSEGKYELQYRLAGGKKWSSFRFEIEVIWYKSKLFYIGLALLFGCISVGFLSYFLRKRAKERNLQRKVSEFKLKALQAQLNPHFLFNCLTSISGLVKMGEYQRAENALHDFAKLMRKVLTLSDCESIPLRDEIVLSKLYLNLEKVRKDELFDYTITYDESFAEFQLPPMTFQPFLENCVKHAFVEKDENNKGFIEISVRFENGHLILTIRDNGIGFQGKENTSSSLHQSRGIELQRERLLEYFQLHQQLFQLFMENNPNEGFEVRLEIEVKTIG
jgi:sensor histidine kinase YesM